MFNKHRLHPVAAISRFLKSLKDLIIPLVIFFFIGNKDSNVLIHTLKFTGMGIVLLSAILISFLSWYRFTYQIINGELRIEYGILVRKKRYIPKERVQTIDVTAGILQRIFGLVTLKIETAGGGSEAEAVLSAVTMREADEIKKLLSGFDENEAIPFDGERIENEDAIYTIPAKELLALASTSGGIGVILSAFFAFYTQVDNFIPYTVIFHRFETFHYGVMFIVLVAIIGVFLAWVLSTLGILLKYGNFRLERKKEELLISSGLLEKRQLILPLAKIQAVRIKQNPLRQLFGLASVHVESAGASSGKEADNNVVLFPIVKMKTVTILLAKFIPEYELPKSFIALPNRASLRYIVKMALPAVPVVAFLIYFLKGWGLISIIVLPILGVIGWFQFKYAGWSVCETSISIKSRLITKSIIILHKRRIQAFESRQSLLQKRNDLQTVEVSIKTRIHGKKFKVVDISEQEGINLMKWYSYTKERTFLNQ